MNPTTTPTAAELFEQFRLDYEAAMNPCVMCLFARCPDSEKAALDALFDHYWMRDGTPTPAYSPVQLRRIDAKMAPLIDRALSDPAVVAHQDQMDAEWRDRPWIKKRWSRLRWNWFVWRTRAKGIGRRKPWE